VTYCNAGTNILYLDISYKNFLLLPNLHDSIFNYKRFVSIEEDFSYASFSTSSPTVERYLNTNRFSTFKQKRKDDLDEIVLQAIDSITGVLESFLPTPTPHVSQLLTVLPKKVKPTGIGGYVGINTDPAASLYGRNIKAISEISLVSSEGLDSLHRAISNITRQLLSQDRATLRNNGIFKLDFNETSEFSRSGGGNNTLDSCSIRFSLEFEYIPQPSVEEGRIEQLQYSLEIAVSSGKASFLRLNFGDMQAVGEDPLSRFDFVDDPDINATSPHGNWGFDPATGSIYQNQDVRGGGTTLSTAKKAGSQALLLDGGEPCQADNMIMKATFFSGDTDGIGFVFRWLDESNFYYYLMSARNNYHLIAKKFEGKYTFLEKDGQNQFIGYEVNQPMAAKLLIEGQHFQVYHNGRFVLSGSDSSISKAGRLGFLSHRNEDAHFLDMELIRFSP